MGVYLFEQSLENLFLINFFIALRLPERLLKYSIVFSVSNSLNWCMSFNYSINIEFKRSCTILINPNNNFHVAVIISMNAALCATETKRDFKRGVLKWWIVWGVVMVEKGIGGWRGHGKLSISTNHLDLITTPALDLQFVSMFQRWMNFYAEIVKFSYPYVSNKYLRFYRLSSLKISLVVSFWFILDISFVTYFSTYVEFILR